LTRGAISFALDEIMKMKILAVLGGLVVATGCVSTVSGTHTTAIWFGRDYVAGRYERSVDQVYQASVSAIQTDGVLLTEYIPHDETNSVRSLYGKVNERKVWVRVEGVDPRITEVTVQARTKMGVSDVDTAHEVEKEIALQLQMAR
jgi:Protein of unknown function (DUF3568)